MQFNGIKITIWHDLGQVESAIERCAHTSFSSERSAHGKREKERERKRSETTWKPEKWPSRKFIRIKINYTDERKINWMWEIVLFRSKHETRVRIRPLDWICWFGVRFMNEFDAREEENDNNGNGYDEVPAETKLAKKTVETKNKLTPTRSCDVWNGLRK